METTLYCSHWEPDDEKTNIPAPTLEIEADDNDQDFLLRIRSGHVHQRSKILVWMTRAQLETLVDAGKVALQEARWPKKIKKMQEGKRPKKEEKPENPEKQEKPEEMRLEE